MAYRERSGCVRSGGINPIAWCGGWLISGFQALKYGEIREMADKAALFKYVSPVERGLEQHPSYHT